MFVKICGTTSEEDALLAVAMGADAVGFIFAASPRQVTTSRASDIVKRLPDEVMKVGVFRDERVERMIEIAMQTSINAVQLHGHESPDDLARIRSQLPLFTIKAFAAASKQVRVADTYKANAVLVDAPSPGSGQIFDWRLADGVPDGENVMLAGGLDASNVADAIESVRPWGVDVVSGVEAHPGKKDATKVREFIERAKATNFERSKQRSKSSREATNAPYDWRDDL